VLVDDVAQELLQLVRNESVEVSDYVVGLRYAAVVVDGSRGREMGLAPIPTEDAIAFRRARKPRRERLLELVGSSNLIEKCLGIAMLNALSQYVLWNLGMVREFAIEKHSDIEVLAVSKMRGLKNIVVVGNLPLIVNEIKRAGIDPLVFERSILRRGRNEALPEELEFRAIQSCEALVLSDETLIDDTIDVALMLSKNARVRILVGLAASLVPRPLFNAGLTHIVSYRVVDVEEAIDVIKLGGDFDDLLAILDPYIVYPRP